MSSIQNRVTIASARSSCGSSGDDTWRPDPMMNNRRETASSDPLQSPLHGRVLYNPALLNRQELMNNFVVREALLKRLLAELREERSEEPTPPQHHLILGQRGMGKTTLLRALRYEVESDPELSRHWLPLTFPEEQYNIDGFAELFLNCLDALSDQREELGDHATASDLDRAMEPLRRTRDAEGALALLLESAQRLDRRLILLVDNLDLILERLRPDPDHWALRELLSSEPRLLLIGASAAEMALIDRHDAAFYDFFTLHELRPLELDESRCLLMRLADCHHRPQVTDLLLNKPERIAALHPLTGGNPRIVSLLFGVLAESAEPDRPIRGDLEALLDRVTPDYRMRMEALPELSQKVMEALATHWHPISAGELAERLAMEVNPISSQLSRLSKAGLVEKVPYYRLNATHPKAKAGYQVAERLFNIWYLMRMGRHLRRSLIWLAEFLVALHGGDRIDRLLEENLRPEELAAWRKLKLSTELDAEEIGKRAGQILRWAEESPLLAVVMLNALVQPESDSPSSSWQQWSDLGDHVLSQSGLDTALQITKRLVELRPDTAIAWHTLCWVHYQQGRFDEEAERVARRTWALAQSESLTVDDRAMVAWGAAAMLATRGRWQEAGDVALEVISVNSDRYKNRSLHWIVEFFRVYSRAASPASALELLERSGVQARYLPLREALAALAAGSRDYFARVAPEMRAAAEQIYEQLQADHPQPVRSFTAAAVRDG